MPTLVYEEPGHKLIHTLNRENIIVKVGPNRFQISDDILTGSQTAISRPDESVLVDPSSFYINQRESLTIALLDDGKGYTIARKD